MSTEDQRPQHLILHHTSSGPVRLLVRSDILESYLSDQKLDFCWAIIGEKQSVGTFGQPHGWLSFQAAYVYRNGRAVGRHNAKYHPEPTETRPSKKGRRRPLTLSKTNRFRATRPTAAAHCTTKGRFRMFDIQISSSSHDEVEHLKRASLEPPCR